MQISELLAKAGPIIDNKTAELKDRLADDAMPAEETERIRANIKALRQLKAGMELQKHQPIEEFNPYGD